MGREGRGGGDRRAGRKRGKGGSGGMGELGQVYEIFSKYLRKMGTSGTSICKIFAIFCKTCRTRFSAKKTQKNRKYFANISRIGILPDSWDLPGGPKYFAPSGHLRFGVANISQIFRNYQPPYPPTAPTPPRDHKPAHGPGGSLDLLPATKQLYIKQNPTMLQLTSTSGTCAPCLLTSKTAYFKGFKKLVLVSTLALAALAATPCHEQPGPCLRSHHLLIQQLGPVLSWKTNTCPTIQQSPHNTLFVPYPYFGWRANACINSCNIRVSESMTPSRKPNSRTHQCVCIKCRHQESADKSIHCIRRNPTNIAQEQFEKLQNAQKTTQHVYEIFAKNRKPIAEPKLHVKIDAKKLQKHLQHIFA